MADCEQRPLHGSGGPSPAQISGVLRGRERRARKITCQRSGVAIAWQRGDRAESRRAPASKRTSHQVFELDEGFTMVIGANHAAIIFEVGIVDGESAPVIIHAMKAREKYLR